MTLQQEHSKIWERYIRQECYALKKAGLAVISKNHEAPTVPGKHIPREKSKPDFSGFLAGAGNHIVFDAKATMSETSFSFHDIQDHQREHLRLAEEFSATSFLYVLDGLRRKWVLPLQIVRHWEEEGRSSYPFGEDSPFEKRPGETFLDTLWRTGYLGVPAGDALDVYRENHPICLPPR